MIIKVLIYDIFLILYSKNIKNLIREVRKL